VPTDTIYGIVGSAFKKKTVERIYRLRRRNPRKPMIVLVSRAAELQEFGVRLAPRERRILEKLWPGRVSVIVPCGGRKFSYLHRGTKSIAFRVPAKKALRALLRKTGPLVAPSANWEGYPPARTVAEARRYFGNRVSAYRSGYTSKTPSTVVRLAGGRLEIVRRGAVSLKHMVQ
jgi:L-threonylcarbamoyladenylate synthase